VEDIGLKGVFKSGMNGNIFLQGCPSPHTVNWSEGFSIVYNFAEAQKIHTVSI
jgi:hypothetical protein